MILLIGGIKNSMRINQERHILNLTIKQVMVILILSLNILYISLKIDHTYVKKNLKFFGTRHGGMGSNYGAPHSQCPGILFKNAQYRVLISLTTKDSKKFFLPAQIPKMESKRVFKYTASLWRHQASHFYSRSTPNRANMTVEKRKCLYWYLVIQTTEH